MDLNSLNEKYKSLSPQERIREIYQDFEKVLVTSSFGTSAVVLLHMLKEVKPGAEVHFIDTRYHFRETYDYARKVTDEWNLTLVKITPERNEHDFTAVDHTWLYEPDSCCQVNKVLPMDELKSKYKVWISGMFGGSADTRKEMPIFKMDGDLVRFYPFADLSPQDADYYRIIYELPPHPLEEKGYGSIGCHHCTRPGEGRAGRWAGKNKTECGLHQFPAGQS